MFRRVCWSLAKLRLEEVLKSFTEHTKRVDVWLKNDSEKRSVILLRGFLHGSGAILAPESLKRVPFSLQECLRLGFPWTESMRRGRDPSRTPSRPRRPMFDNRREQLPGTDIRSDADNLYKVGISMESQLKE